VEPDELSDLPVLSFLARSPVAWAPPPRRRTAAAEFPVNEGIPNHLQPRIDRADRGARRAHLAISREGIIPSGRPETCQPSRDGRAMASVIRETSEPVPKVALAQTARFGYVIVNTGLMTFPRAASSIASLTRSKG
jgi:hypothetical protein